MKHSRNLFFIICIFFAFNFPLQAQQWNGSPNTSGAIYRDGKIGIGNQTPTGTFDIFSGNNPSIAISGTGAGSSHLYLFTSRPDASKLFWSGTAGSGNEGWMIAARNKDFSIADRRGDLEFYHWDDQKQKWSLPFAIDKPTSNVGIWTPNPKYPLDVNGTLSAGKPGKGQVLLNLNSERNWQFRQVGSGGGAALELVNIGGGGNKNFRVTTTGSLTVGPASTWAPSGYRFFAAGPASVGNAGRGQVLLNLNSERNWQFRQVGSGAGTALELASIGGGGGKNFRITTTGSLTVGPASTWAPSGYKFAVDGKAIVEEIKVQLSQNWADYVFAEDYQLRDLSEVKQYVQEHKHLPGVPSAKEIESEGGFEIGEMQRVMMEKIEELTLYMIDLKEENERLKKQVNELKKY